MKAEIDMDPILALIVIEQTIATVVIAAAIVIYSRATTRILEAHLEPEVHVTIEGGPDGNTLVISNSAGCAVSNLNVIISAGCVWGAQPYPPRHCVYFRAWETIAAGSTEKTAEQPITRASFTSARLPDGARVDDNDIFVEYSFTRRADRRRYAFKYQLGIFQQPDGQLTYICMGRPKMLSKNQCAPDEQTIGIAHSKGPKALGLGDVNASLRAAAPCIG